MLHAKNVVDDDNNVDVNKVVAASALMMNKQSGHRNNIHSLVKHMSPRELLPIMRA